MSRSSEASVMTYITLAILNFEGKKILLDNQWLICPVPRKAKAVRTLIGFDEASQDFEHVERVK